jgi:hypothetical protein
VKQLEIEQMKDTMSSRQISDCFVFEGFEWSEEERNANCICGVDISKVYWFLNKVSRARIPIGSECVNHWLKDDKLMKYQSKTAIEVQEIKLKKKQNDITLDMSCFFCGRKTTKMKCQKCIKVYGVFFQALKKNKDDEKKKREMEKKRYDEEEIPIDVSIEKKEIAKDIARKHNIFIKFDYSRRVWLCPRKYAYLFIFKDNSNILTR